ncbi:MAG: YafY family transcriptional regulator [Treponema sp.]|nr:YafY family transcriptional regulator [Treponema sp.]
MQIEELFEFVYILIDKKKVTAREISERFGVSTRTVYRWLEALSLSGIPVYSMKGRGGGIAISEKYALDNRILSDEEKLAILSSVKALNSLSGSQNSAVNANSRAVEKLSRLVSVDADWLEVDFAPWSPAGQDVRKLFSTLRESILKKRQLAFDYFRGDGNLEKRIVHPWKLVYRGQAWYLQGWCTSRKAERFFKLTRMRNVEMTNRSATVTKKENPSESEKVTQKVPELLKIKALVFPPRISYLLDTFICSQVLPQKDGSILATFSVPNVDWIYDMLLSFHANMKIISPEAVREKVLSLAKNVQKLYED